jgi:DNA-directed RNA polymerase III subunit RPC4
MIIFKLPAVLPRIEQPVSSKGKEKIGTSKVSKKGTNLLELPSGCIGKMQVYKSGAVKLKIGETLYDVSSIHVSKLTISTTSRPKLPYIY